MKSMFKALIGVQLIFISVVINTVVAQTCVTPPSGLVSWWPLDETSGTATADIVGASPGTHSGGPIPVPGKVAGALSFDGFDGGVASSSKNWGFSTTATVAAWIKTTATDGPVFSLAHDTIEDEMLLRVTGGKIGIFNHKSAFNWITRLSDSVVNTGDWVFVAGVLDGGGSAANLKIFVNGVQETGTILSDGTPTDIVDTTPRSATIGSRLNWFERFNGMIDEVEIYNRALSQSEIQAIFNAGSAGKCKPDISITQSDNPDPVTAGNELTYTLTVTNNESQNAINVVVTDNLPASGVAFVSAIPSQGTCNEAAGIVSCSLGDLGIGSSATVTITVFVNPLTTGTLTNTASATSDTVDLDTSNNSATETSGIVSPSAVVGDGVVLGDGTVIGDSSTLDQNVQTGDNTVIGDNVEIKQDTVLGSDTIVGDSTIIEKDVQTGDSSVIGNNVVILKNTVIGNNVQIGDNTQIGKDCTIGNNVVIENGVTIGNAVQIGDGATVLDGAIVKNSAVIPPGTTFPP